MRTKTKILSILIVFISSMSIFICPVDALYLAQDDLAVTTFSPSTYDVNDYSNNTIVTLTGYIYPFYDYFNGYKTFIVNIDLDDLPTQTWFEYACLSYKISRIDYYAPIEDIFQSRSVFYVNNWNTSSYDQFTYWYYASGWFGSDISTPTVQINTQTPAYASFIDENILYMPSVKILLGDHSGASTYAFIQFQIEINLYKDSNGTYTPPSTSIDAEIFNPNYAPRQETEGKIWERFIENATLVVVVIALPIVAVYYLNKKFLGLSMIICAIIGYVMGLIDVIGIVITFILAILIMIKQSKTEVV